MSYRNSFILIILSTFLLLSTGCFQCESDITGGNLNIGFSGSHWTPRIDAHPEKTGDFQFEANIDSQKIYLTEDGFREFSKLNKSGYKAYMFEDTKGGFFTVPTPEQFYTGKP